MKSSRLLPILILLCCSVAVQATTNPENIPLSFPFFQSGQISGARDELMVGYGDYTTTIASEEGLHMGIDLYPESAADQVLNPFDATMYSLGAFYTDTVDGPYTGCHIGIGPEGSDYGWALEHMGLSEYHEPNLDLWCEYWARGKVLTPGMPIDSCIDYSGGSVPLHTHVQWSHWTPDASPGGARINNPWDALVNPFSFFKDSTELSGYDQVSFKAAWPEIWFFYPDSTSTGIFFLPDGIAETCSAYVSTVGEENKLRFQDIIYSSVDIVVQPFSELLDYPGNTGCGVQSLSYQVLRQNPLDPADWQTTESSQGSWGIRYLFTAEGQIEEPSVWVDIYESLFYDRCLFENAYIVTNSGALDPSSWQHGWSNVWTDSSDDDWENGICRGAWNTFLANPGITGNPVLNSQAFFPDGRYAVEVTAVSHASRNTSSMLLPVDDLSLTNPTVQGVVVDNFIPSIEELKVYTFDTQSGGGFAHVIYHENWIVDSTGYSSRTAESVASGYLSGCASDKLGIAVRYSEEMDPDSLGRFWVTGEWGDQTVYTSLNDRRRWLHPVEGFREGLEIDSTECWYCYETFAALNFMVTGYIGRLSLHVGDSSIPMDAVDLAGNTLDYDPSTVAAPRNPVTGLFDYTYVESEPYDTGSWGVPSYRKVSSGVFLGGVFGKTFYVTPGITGSLIGDCPYWCGFWLERQRPEITSPIIVDIVEPDGSYTTTTIFSGDSCSLDEYALTPAPIAGRYGWFLWCTVWYDPIIIVIPPDTIPRYKYHFRATVIDSWNPGSILHTEDLGVGQSWPVAQTVHTPMIEAYGVHYESDENERGPWHPSGIRIVDGPLGDGSVYIERNYSIYPDGWLIDTVLVELPSVVDHYETNPPEDVPLYGLRVNSLIPEYSISPTSPNPCHNSVTINFSLLEQGPTEVTVFDISGRTVRRLVDCVVMEGVHDVIWDLKDDSNERVPSGLYFVRIQSGDWTGTTRLIVAR